MRKNKLLTGNILTLELQKLYKRRRRKANFISTLLARLPFVRCVILNGSLAQGKIKRQSDIDLLIISQSGRIFTARAFCILLVWLSGYKRSSDNHKFHGGRFCLNYFLTSEFLIVPHNRSHKINKYCAENYSKSVLLAGDEKLFEKFIRANEKWMSKYLGINSKFPCLAGRQVISPKGGPFGANVGSDSKSQKTMEQWNRGTIQKVTEYVLGGNFGNCLEAWFKRIQLARINRDPRTIEYPDLIVANDKEMRFHLPKK